MRSAKSRNAALLRISAILLVLVTASTALAQIDHTSVAGQFSWREVGPANPGGRITDVEGVESSPNIIYVGAATGGVWKTVNAGITWEPIFDDQPNASIGDIGLSRSNPNILYVGTGEPNNRNSSPWGSGVFKSTDGGETWEYVGLKETHHIGRIIVHPTDPDIVYVAALGHLWGTNEERGVFKSTNGGRSWRKMLYFDERTGVTDLAMDPADSDILYAAAHERLRDRFDAGDPVDQWGPHAGIYVTRNGGDDWTRCTEGLPTGEMGRIGLDASRSRPGTVYALVSVQPPPRDPSAPRSGMQRGGQEAEETLDPNRDGIFKTTDYGETWEKVNNWNNRPSYYSQIRVDPNDAEVIWGFGSPMAYSDDGGRTVIAGRDVQGSTHIDYHSCWIDPNDSDHLIVGGDGGINITWDRGKNWEIIQEIGLAQLYAITADMRKPYYLAGGLQDNGVWVGASRGRITRAVTNSDWFPLSNADGFFCQIDPTDFNTIYAETQGGSIYRHDLRTGQRRGIRPRPPAPAEGEERERYRFDWNTPFLLSPHNPRTLYLGGNKLFKSVDRGDNWQAVGPDLTAQVDERNSAIVTVSESSIVPGLLWVGTNDGNVQMSRNDGATWTLLNDNIPGAPARYWVKRIEASHHEAGRAFLVYDGHRHDDQAPYVFMTDDYGQSWRNITGNLPEGSCYVIREDFINPDLLFVGTEFAVHYSLDRGETWHRFMTGMPTVPFHDLLIHPRDADLIAGTHGRGAWIVNNLTPLQQLTAEVMEEDVRLLDIRPEVQWLTTYEFSWTTDKRFYKPNPPTGSTIAYYLKDDVSDPVTIEILDLTGAVIRTLEGSQEAGLNTFFWDFRGDPPTLTEAQAARMQQMGRMGSRRGAAVSPGEYLVRLTVGSDIQTTILVIEQDVPGYMGR